jgi:hypothetical protein
MGDEIQLVMPVNITFETDRADIQSNFYDVLNDVALVLKEYDQTLVEISGFTDDTGEELIPCAQRAEECRALHHPVARRASIAGVCAAIENRSRRRRADGGLS